MKNEGYKFLSARLPKSLHLQARIFAAKRGETISEFTRQALTQAMKSNSLPKKEKSRPDQE